MATINAFIRTTKTAKEATVRFRLTDGRKVQLLYKSNIKVLPEHFDAVRQQCINQQHDANMAIAHLKRRITTIYNTRHPKTSAELKALLVNPQEKELLEFFNAFLAEKARVVSSIQTYHSLYYCLCRYEAYKQITITIDMLTKAFIIDFEQYMQQEWQIVRDNPQLFETFPAKQFIKPRGLNTIAKQMQSLSTFCNWLITNNFLQKNPLLLYRKPVQVYGTPFFLTIEEREKIYRFDYGIVGRDDLNQIRDVFVFQCLVGCRVSDLFKLRQENIRGDFLEYIPQKTMKECPKVVRVPLTRTAKTILKRYKTTPYNILPFNCRQQYNENIRELVRLAGINRVVTILDTQTRQEVNKPIHEVASSHMARRTFIGNLYNKIQDPNLIASMSGHTEGSRAFARYRSINDDVKKNIIGLLE